MKKRLFFVFGILLAVALLTAACGSDLTAMTPEELISKSAEHMGELAGYEFSLDYEGDPVVMDASTGATFTFATGQYTAPDAISATVKAAAGPMTVEVSMITVGGSQWITNPLTGAWSDVTGAYSLQPDALLNGKTGVYAIIAENIESVTDFGEEEIEEAPGVSLKHLTGTLTGETLTEVSGGMFSTGTLSVDLWIDATTYDLYRVQLEDTQGGVWKLDFWNFGSTFDIQPPQ